MLTAALVWLVCDADLAKALLAALFPGKPDLLYPRADLLALTLEHLGLVCTSSLLSAAVGCGLAMAVSRPQGQFLRPVAERLAALAQTFPPAAVLALTIPMLGFGFGPAVLGLWLFGTLPVLQGALSGFSEVPAEVLDAGRGLGLGATSLLFRVELPLAFPYLWAGLRTSVVINVGTAALGATIGAGGLGAPIVSGLVTQNYAFLLEGGVTSGLLALAADSWFSLGAPPGRTSQS